MFFEFIVYCDRLLQEVGLSSHRKAWFQDLFSPCRMRGMAGLRDEYLAKYDQDAAILAAWKHGLPT